MTGISDVEKQKVLEALDEAGANLPCPRCGNGQFSLVDGYFNHPIQTSLGGLVIGGPSVPSVVVVCNKCGFISQHALGALNLLPKTPEPGEVK
jgi:ribosomal protein S27AE